MFHGDIEYVGFEYVTACATITQLIRRVKMIEVVTT
jgi:hypothetical protein